MVVSYAGKEGLSPLVEGVGWGGGDDGLLQSAEWGRGGGC